MKVSIDDYDTIIRGHKVHQLPFSHLKRLEAYQSSKLEETVQMSKLMDRSRDLIRGEVSSYNLTKKVLQRKAALKIQKFARGYILRSKHDSDFLSNRKQELHYSIFQLTRQTEHCLLNLGANIDSVVSFLQRNIRIFLFRRKLYYLGLCFEHLVESRLENASEILRPFIRIYCCKVKIIMKQFKAYKKKVLKKVKRRLAVITIKKAWKFNGLTFQMMRDRLVKRKRRYLARKSKNLYKKVMTSKFASSAIQKRYRQNQPLHNFENTVKDSYITLGTNEASKGSLAEKEEEGSSKISSQARISNSNIGSQIKISQLQSGNSSQGGVSVVEEVNEAKPPPPPVEDDSEIDELANQYDDELLREMNLRRISYNIRDMREIPLRPLIDKSSIRNHLLSSTFTTDKKKSPRPYFESISFNRNTQIDLPLYFPHKIGLKKSLPPLSLLNSPNHHRKTPSISPTKKVEQAGFLTSTESFTRRRRISDKNKKKEPQTSPFLPPPKKRILKETIAHQLKQNMKARTPVEKLWVPITKKKERYLPGIDNSAFVPVSWSPIPFVSKMPSPVPKHSTPSIDRSIISLSPSTQFQSNHQFA